MVRQRGKEPGRTVSTKAANERYPGPNTSFFLILSVLWIFIIHGYNNHRAHKHGENVTPDGEIWTQEIDWCQLHDICENNFQLGTSHISVILLFQVTYSILLHLLPEIS